MRWSRPLLVLLLGLLAGRTAAGPAWAVKKWDLEDGLPSLAITGLAQAEDGFLWIATRAMLTRFDGQAFENFPSTEFLAGPLRGFRAMLPDRAGGLWLTADPNILVHLGAGAPRTFLLPFTGPPFAMAEDATGAIWITYATGAVCRVAGGQVEVIGPRAGCRTEGVAFRWCATARARCGLRRTGRSGCGATGGS